MDAITVFSRNYPFRLFPYLFIYLLFIYLFIYLFIRLFHGAISFSLGFFIPGPFKLRSSIIIFRFQLTGAVTVIAHIKQSLSHLSKGHRKVL